MLAQQVLLYFLSLLLLHFNVLLYILHGLLLKFLDFLSHFEVFFRELSHCVKGVSHLHPMLLLVLLFDLIHLLELLLRCLHLLFKVLLMLFGGFRLLLV